MKCDKFLNFRNLILRKNKTWALLCLLAYTPSQADLIVRASSTPFVEYAAWIATHPEDQSWVQYLENHYPSKSESKRISILVENSQKAFLTGSLEDAKKIFKEIADLADTNDWRHSEREAITYSMLRFSQLEKSVLGLSYLKKAARYGYDVHFDAKIFPPPLLNHWKSEIAIARKKSIKISNLKDFNGFEIIKIDGRSYSLSECEFISILQGEHRISFLGSHAQYFTQKITSSQLQVMALNPVALISGSCSSPVLNAETHLQFKALFGDSCGRIYNGQTWTRSLKPGLEKLEMHSTNYKNSQSNLLSEARVAPPLNDKRKWVWIGLSTAIIASLAMVYQNNQNQLQALGNSSNSQSSYAPTHTEGN